MRKNKEYRRVEEKYGAGGTQGKEKMKHVGQSEWKKGCCKGSSTLSTEVRNGREALKKCTGGVK